MVNHAVSGGMCVMMLWVLLCDDGTGHEHTKSNPGGGRGMVMYRCILILLYVPGDEK